MTIDVTKTSELVTGVRVEVATKTEVVGTAEVVTKVKVDEADVKIDVEV